MLFFHRFLLNFLALMLLLKIYSTIFQSLAQLCTSFRIIFLKTIRLIYGLLFINKIWGVTTPFFEPRLTDNCSLQTLYACCLQCDPPQIPSMSYISSWVIRYTKVNPPTRFNKHNLVQKSCAMCQKCLSFHFWANTLED